MNKTASISKERQFRDSEKKILLSAKVQFVKRGYHGTTIDNITKAAGLTKGAFYWHFKTKYELVKRIVEDFETGYVDNVIEAVQRVNGGAIDKLQEYFRFSAAFANKNPELTISFTTLSVELLGSKPLFHLQTHIRKVYKKHQKFLLELIEEGKKEAVFRKDRDSELDSLVIMAFHDGALLHWSMNRGKVSGKEYVKAYNSIIKHGIFEP